MRMVGFFEKRKLISSKGITHPVSYSKKSLAATGIKMLSSRKDGNWSGLILSNIILRDERENIAKF